MTLFQMVITRKASTSARYECLDIKNESLKTLTTDFLSIGVRKPDSTASKVYDFSKSAALNHSSHGCQVQSNWDGTNLTAQLFILNWPESESSNGSQQLQLAFVQNKTSYYLENVVYLTSEKNETYEVKKPDLKLGSWKHQFRVHIQGYNCPKVSFTLTEKKDPSKKVELEMNEWQFVAYKSTVNPKKAFLLECLQDPGSSIVPMVVGGGLVLLASVVVGVYFVMRRKREKTMPEIDDDDAEKS